MSETTTSVLYDHYKDTFDDVRNREKARERLFVIVVVLLSLLVIQLRYVGLIPETLTEIEVAGVRVEANKIPYPVFVSATWTFLVVFLLRYFQVVVHIEKELHYLHSLEARVSAAIGQPKQGLYREGRGYYATKSKCFRTWVWIFYVAVFPAVVCAGITLSLFLEWGVVPSIGIGHKIYDTAMSTFLVVLVVFYMMSVRSGEDCDESSQPN